MRTLAPAQRRAFRAQAHSLHPVVAIGQHGLTAAVLHEIDVNLLAHELIKIRVFGDDRGAREVLLARICGDLDAAPVQHLGKILTIWRPAPPPEPQTFARRADRIDRVGKAAQSKKPATVAPSLSQRSSRGSNVKRAPRRGRSVIVDAEPLSKPRRRVSASSLTKAGSPHPRTRRSRAVIACARRSPITARAPTTWA